MKTSTHGCGFVVMVTTKSTMSGNVGVLVKIVSITLVGLVTSGTVTVSFGPLDGVTVTTIVSTSSGLTTLTTMLVMMAVCVSG